MISFPGPSLVPGLSPRSHFSPVFCPSSASRGRAGDQWPVCRAAEAAPRTLKTFVTSDPGPGTAGAAQPAQAARIRTSQDGDFNGQCLDVSRTARRERMDLSLDKETGGCRESGLARVTWSGDQSHGSSLHTSLASLQSSASLVDVSLVSSSGHSLAAHRIVLAAASELFRNLFEDNEEKVNRNI